MTQTHEFILNAVYRTACALLLGVYVVLKTCGKRR